MPSRFLKPVKAQHSGYQERRLNLLGFCLQVKNVFVSSDMQFSKLIVMTYMEQMLPYR